MIKKLNQTANSYEIAQYFRNLEISLSVLETKTGKTKTEKKEKNVIFSVSFLVFVILCAHTPCNVQNEILRVW